MRGLALAALVAGCSSPSEFGGLPPQPAPPVDTGVIGTDLGHPEAPPYDGILQFDGAPPKNLLFLSIDTYRKDHLGAYGSDLTPFLDTITEHALVMDEHYQCSNWTGASTTCTLAGRTNVERGHIPSLGGSYGGSYDPVQEYTPFLASWLGLLDFTSVLSCTNPRLSTGAGNAQGYDLDLQQNPYSDAVSAGRAGYEALEGLMAAGKVPGPWFLHLHFLNPHSPYDPAEEWIQGEEGLDPWPTDLSQLGFHYRARDNYRQLNEEDRELLEAHLRNLYEAEVRELDDELRTLWDELRAEGLLEDTLVVMWNDHGEQFWEHGAQTHAHHLYGEENDGILFFWADNIVPGRFSDATSSVDLVPTLLEFFGIPHLPSELTGYPIGKRPEGTPIHAESLARQGALQMVVVGDLKLHYDWKGEVKVFDRSTDPGEQVDLYDPTDARTLELWGHLRPMIDKMVPLTNLGLVPVIPDGLP